MSKNVFLAYDQVPIGKGKIVEENKRFLKVSAVISKAGVYKYDDGMALKSIPELQKAVRSARYAKLTLADHPPEKIIMSQDQIFGGVEKPYFDKDKIRAILSFDKEVVPEETLRKVRAGDYKDVSIGFYYVADWTPGWARDVNTDKPIKYDYRMTNIMIDHVVTALNPNTRGRCTFPSCGISADSLMKFFSVEDDRVEKRGSQWCVIHCSGPDTGKPIKCFPTKGEAEAMHRAIMARKHGNQTDLFVALEDFKIDIERLTPEIRMLLFGLDAEPPSKQWMDNCKAKAENFAKNPGAFCGWVWYHGPTALKRSFGASSVPIKGVKTKMSQEEETAYAKCVREKKAGGMTDEEAREACKELKTDQDEESEYAKCVREKKAQGMTDEEAREACQAKKTDQEKLQTAYEKCLADKKAEGMTQEEAEAACEALKPTAADQEKTPWQLCIQEEMAAGKTKEQARMACKQKGLKGPAQDQETVAQPVATKPEEPLPTPLELCIASRMEAQGEDAATAKKWCEDEAAGKHQPVSKIIDNINRLRAKKRDLNRR